MKRLAGLVLTLQIGLGVVVTQLYLSSHHSLYNNGNWIATKTTLARSVMGAYSYLFSLQTLHGGRLNLAAWHGYQEVVSREAFDLEALQFDFLLRPNAHLTLKLNRTDAGYSGVRISRNGNLPAIVFTASAAGQFSKKRRIEGLQQASLEGWHTMGVRMLEEDFAVVLDGQELATYTTAVARPQRIGFRGGKSGSLVDNIRVVERDGSVFRETFERPGAWLWVSAVGVAAIPLLSIILFLLLRKVLRVSDKLLGFYFLMFTAVLIMAGVMLYGFLYRQKQYYPNADEKLRLEEEYGKENAAERIFDLIEREYGLTPNPDVIRLVFLGSSQTYGSGAAIESETLVRQTERLLNERSGGPRFECINTAIHGYKLRDMARDYAERWAAMRPNLVVVNASNNDIGAGIRQFKRWLTEIIELSKGAGIKVVLVAEPNSPERDRTSLPKYHAHMTWVGDRYGIPVLDMHGYLASRQDDGFLWWDWVHMTSFGQRLFAEELVDNLIELGLVDLDPVDPGKSSADHESRPARRPLD